MKLNKYIDHTLLKQDATILVIGEHKAIKRWFNI